MKPPSRSGVFESGTDERLVRFSESISFDHRLYRQDIRGSIAHARMLAQQGILQPSEFDQIESCLRGIEKEIDEGRFSYRFELEDIHMHIEQALIDRLGDVGRKLHTARSRNDQVSTDLRMWVREALDRVDDLLRNLQIAFLTRCDHEVEIVLPAYTHLQRAQPVVAAHYWLAYIEKFSRDRERVKDCRRRVNVCPLGGAAVAGTTFPIDREATARELGFESIAANSIDISSDRDFVLESASTLSVIAVHLSGWAEEWILWSTTEFGFLRLPQAFCTGSSIMPQKINPDTLELIRGKSARVLGNLSQLLVLMKGLPLAYNRDLQEDKPAIFDSFDTIEHCLELAIPIVRQTELRAEKISEGLHAGFLDATALMESLIERGFPQRTAHHLVGALVGIAQRRGVSLAELTDEELKEAHSDLTSEILKKCGLEAAVHAYKSFGSSHPDFVRKAVARWKQELQYTEA